MTRAMCIVAVIAAACAPTPVKGPERALQIVHNRGGNENVRRVALDDRYFYVLDGNTDSFGIRRFPRGGGRAQVITEDNERGDGPTAIAVDATHIYWLTRLHTEDDDEAHTLVFRAEKQPGARLEELIKVDGNPGDLIFFGDELVFSTVDKAPAVHRVRRDGNGHSIVLQLPAKSEPVDLLARGNAILVADQVQNSVFELTLAGETRELMKADTPRELAAYGDQLAVVCWRGVFDVGSGKQIARGSREAEFDALAAAPEGLYYRHQKQLRFLAWGAQKARILQKAQFDIEDIVIADEGLYYVDSNEVWFRARAGAR